MLYEVITIKLTSQEILSADNHFLETAKVKIVGIIAQIEQYFGITRIQQENFFSHYLQNDNALKNIGVSLDFIKDRVSGLLTTSFVGSLLLSGSLNFEKILNNTLFKVRHSSIKAFRRIVV